MRRAQTRRRDLIDSGRTLASYTSASNAIRIIESRRLTLRNSLLMNDFQEIEHGMRCLATAWGSEHGGGSETNRTGRLARLFERLFPGMLSEIEKLILDRTHLRKRSAFLFCLTEHDNQTEGQFGRLSMWRAYGGESNVALIFNRDLLSIDDAQHFAFLSPVEYRTPSDFVGDFAEFVSCLEENVDTIATTERWVVLQYLSFALEAAMLSLKHPGFAEEREWRFIYSSLLVDNSTVPRGIITIDDVPQPVVYIPFKVNETEIPVSSVVQNLLIGPVTQPYVLEDAFVAVLQDAGIPDPQTLITISTIPLRR